VVEDTPGIVRVYALDIPNTKPLGSIVHALGRNDVALTASSFAAPLSPALAAYPSLSNIGEQAIVGLGGAAFVSVAEVGKIRPPRRRAGLR